MAIIFQSKALNLLEFNDTTGTLIVKLPTGNSNSFQEWQNSSGNVLAKVDSYGNFRSGAMSIHPTLGTFTNATAQIKGNSSTIPVLALQNYNSSTTSNMLEFWEYSGSTLRAKVDANGSATFTGSESTNAISAYSGAAGNYVFQGFNQSNNLTSIIYQSGEIYSASNIYVQGAGNYSAAVNVKPGSTSTSGIVVRGLASQTADIQKWQNSAGTDLVKVSSTGKVVVAADGESAFSMITTSQAANGTSIVSTTSTSNDYAITLNATGGGNFSNVGMAFSVFGGTGFNGVATPGGAIWFTRTGSYSVGYLSLLTRSSTGANDPLVERMRVGETGTVSIAGFTASSVGLIVKGATSQTADLQQWQNVGGTVLAKVANDGTSMLGAIYTTYGPHKIYGSLENWGTPSGVASTSILAYGYAGSASLAIGVKNTDNADNRNWQLTTGGGGYAGQSGAYIGEGGLMFLENNPNDSSSVFRGGFRRGGQFTFGSENTYSASLSITPLSTSTKGQVIRGLASQTENLQEWQDSSGGILALINNSGQIATYGRLTVGSSYISTDARMVLLNTGTTSSVLQIIRGMASQTGDLQQWQNSAGTVLAKVDASGNFVVNGVTISQSASSVSATQLGTVNNRVFLKEENSGGQLRLTKSTASAANNRATDLAQLYLRDGTTAGTLKLVIIAGTTGAETTILDNIPQ
jgi:hypothetical protein